MDDSPNFNERNKLKPITSLNQLVSTYLVSKAVVHIRAEREAELNNRVLELKPKLDSTNERYIDLFNRFSKIIDYKEGLMLIAKRCMDDMIKYEFKNDPSITISAHSDTAHLRSAFNTSYSQFEKINLEDHTLRVFENGILDAESQGGRAIKVAIPLLGCLLHDFGKSSKLRAELVENATGDSFKVHATVSKIYVDEILLSAFLKSENTLEMVSLIVENHHPSNNKMKNDASIKFIINADHKSRKQELKIIKQGV